MLTEEQLKKVNELLAGFSREEQLWLSGYIAGANQGGGNALTDVPAPKVGKVTIAYGTETGNSKKIATQLAAKAKQKKITTKLVSLEQYKASEFSKEEHFFAVVSTHGDGEPPAAAKSFYDFILASNQQFPNLKYSVLALGDSAYPLFCKAGADIDEKLNTLGAKRISVRGECDVDYEADANTWIENVLSSLTSSSAANAAAPTVAPPKKPSGKTIYKGKINTNINLNDTGSNKETHHIEIVSADGRVDYQPGDSIGIIPLNEEKEVSAILHRLQISGSNFVQYKDKQYTFAQLLRGVFSIRQLPARVVAKYATAENSTATIPTPIDLVDLLEKIPPVKTKENPLLFLEILETITPRLYSIASSNDAHNEEVHICVAQDWFTKNDQKVFGLGSKYLNGLAKGASVEFYIQRNNLFRLPDDEKDIIMIGPGTGIAPFRAFVAERDARGASGENWLFFGDQHFRTDFLYQTEWQSYLETGALAKLDVAFSRDTDKKVYVQHKLKQNAQAVFEWLESGAYLYVCGSKEPMSADVEKALLEIITEQSGKDEAYATEYLSKLKEEERYLKDVY